MNRQPRVITVANQKGGVAKTTTAHHLIAGLTERGYHVLGVDMDAQGNLSYLMNAKANTSSVYEVMKGETQAADCIQKTEAGSILPANILLSGADMEFSSTGREYRLRDALDPIKGQYDFIVIDTPPALSILTVNAFTASDCIVIPMFADMFSIQGAGQLKNTIDQTRKYCNPKLKIQGILLTRYNARNNVTKDLTELTEQFAKRLDTKTYNAKIRQSVAVTESQAMQTDLYQHADKEAVTSDYRNFISELLEDIQRD